MSNLDRPDYPEGADDALEWAVDREFELREARYDFLKRGGLTGAMERVTAQIQNFNVALAGLPDE